MLALGAAVALAAALTLRRLDLAAALRGLAHLRLAPWLAAVALVIAAKLGAKLARSHGLLAVIATPPPPLATTARVLVASHAAGQLAWAPLGFTVRTLGLRASGLDVRSLVRIHASERLAEAVALIAATLMALPLAPARASLGVGAGVAIAVGAALAVAAVAYGAPRLRARLRGWAVPTTALGAATGWALVAMAADVAIVALAARAAGVALGLDAALVVAVAIAGGTAVPLTPAQLGVQEAAFVLALGWFGVDAEAGLAVALAYRLAHALPLAAIGGPALAVTLWPRGARHLTDLSRAHPPPAPP
ncbi:MAG: flippase-like domain-containing protein [Myxococcales bacterium]|nr:flippase-like domain-containing protein [Myxococcales bacterium]